MQNLKISQSLWWLFLFLLTVPLWFIFVNPYHDWGDDFAQYLLQARNASSLTFGSTAYAPSVKGWLFSVLLRPAVIWFPSNEILAAKVIVTALAAASVFPIYFLVTRRLLCNSLTAIALCGFYVFNFQSLLIKDQIVPEFAFILTSALAICLTSSLNSRHVVLGVAIALLTVGIKSSGWVLFSVLLVVAFRKGVVSKFQWWIFLLLACITLAVAFYFLPSQSGAVWYIQQTLTRFSFQTIVNHASIYYHTIPKFFEMELPMWMNNMIFLFFLAGWLGATIRSIRNYFDGKSDLLDTITAFQLLYLLMLLCYPYAGEPFRFLFPLLPFALLSCVSFYNRLLLHSGLQNWLGIALFFVMLTNLSGVQKAMKMRPDYGPFQSQNIQLFQFLKSHPESPATRCSEKPFAFTYFTGLLFVPISEKVPSGSRWVISRGSGTDIVHPDNMVEVYSNSQWRVFDEQNPRLP